MPEQPAPEAAPAAQPAPEAAPQSSNEDVLKYLMGILGPVVDFHKAVEHASDNDLRVFWDIRLVQGKDTPFTSMSGHSSFPGVLVGSALGQLPSMMSREIVDKIAVPLGARLQDMTNDIALGSVVKNITVNTSAPAPNKNRHIVDAMTAEELLPTADRTELLNVMLPKEIVEDAAGIMAELKKHE